MSGFGLLSVLRIVVALAVLAPLCLFYVLTRAQRRARMSPLARAILDGEERKEETIREAQLRRTHAPAVAPALAAREPVRPAPAPASAHRPFPARPARAMEDSAVGA